MIFNFLNSFSTNVPLLYPLKTSENWRFFDVFRGYRSGTLVENGLMASLPSIPNSCVVDTHLFWSSHQQCNFPEWYHIPLYYKQDLLILAQLFPVLAEMSQSSCQLQVWNFSSKQFFSLRGEHLLETLLDSILDIFWIREPVFDPELCLPETPLLH